MATAPGARHGVVEFPIERMLAVSRYLAGLYRLPSRRHVGLRGERQSIALACAGAWVDASSMLAAIPIATAPCARIALAPREEGRISVYGFLQFGSRQAERGSIHEYGWIARVDERCLNAADARDLQHVCDIPRREHRTAFLVGPARVEEFDCDLGSREGHPVKLEVALFDNLAAVIGTCATIFRPMLTCQMRTVATPSRGAATRPSVIENGPTAPVRLPQLPDQSIIGRSIATCPKR